MSKKTERSEAVAAAESVLKTKTAIKKLQSQLEADMALVREYVQSTGEYELGDARAYERRNAPKLVATKRGVDVGQVLEKFTSQVSYKYSRSQLDLSKMVEAQDSDQELKKLLKRFGLRVDQDTAIQIKHY
jgi:hypothetical protein